jgi:hypothetical protein
LTTRPLDGDINLHPIERTLGSRRSMAATRLSRHGELRMPVQGVGGD